MRLRFGKTLTIPTTTRSAPHPAIVPVLLPKSTPPPAQPHLHNTRRMRRLTRIDLVELKNSRKNKKKNPPRPSSRTSTPIRKPHDSELKPVETTPDFRSSVIMQEEEVSFCEGIINFSEEEVNRMHSQGRSEDGCESGGMEEESAIDFQFLSSLERPIPFGPVYDDIEAEPV